MTTNTSAGLDSSNVTLSYLREVRYRTRPRGFSNLDGTAIAANGVLTHAATDFRTGFQVGDHAQVGGLSATNNGTYRVTAVASGSITFDGTFTAQASVDDVTVLAVHQKLRLTSEGFTEAKTRTRPDEIRADGQASQARTTQVSASGTLSGGLSAGTYDDFIRAMVNGGQFEDTVDVSDYEYIVDNNGNGRLNSSRATLTDLSVGRFVSVRGFKDDTQDGLYKVVVTSANRLTLSGPGAAFTETEASTSATGAGITPGSPTTTTALVSVPNQDPMLEVGDHVRLSNTGNASANDVYVVTSVSTGTFGIRRRTGVTTAIPTVTNRNMTIRRVENLTIKQGGMVRNGNAVETFEVQKQMSSGLFFYYPGAFISGGSVNAELGALATVNFDFIASSENKATATRSQGDEREAPDGTIIDTVEGIQNAGLNRQEFDDAGGLDTILQSLSFSVTKNNARAQYGVGSASGRGIGRGTVAVEGAVTVYFRNFEMYDLYVAETGREMSFACIDDDDNGYVFSFPNVTLVNPSIVAGGPDSDLLASFTMEANPGTFAETESPAATNFTIQIDRVIA